MDREKENILIERLRRAIKQFWKYCLVGASGVFINFGVYSFLVGYVHVHYLIGATASFVVAVTSNFILNKYWTFGNPEGDTFTQASRFLIIALTSLVLNLFLLGLLIESLHMHNKYIAQAIAISAVTIINFSGNKLWSFRQSPT